MAQDNFATITGNVTRDPELRFTPGGQAVANFGVAVNRRWQNRQTQEWEEATSFFDVTAWQKLGENVAESLRQGMRVTVSGRLDQQRWEKDGQKRSKVQIVADEVAPSLKWATAVVTKNPRDDDGGRGPSRERERPASAASSPMSVYGSTPSANPDEEPF